MATAAIGAKTLGVIKGTAPHCVECATVASLTGKGLSFGLGIGLGSALPFIFVVGGLYLASRFMKQHLRRDILMYTDQDSQ